MTSDLADTGWQGRGPVKLDANKLLPLQQDTRLRCKVMHGYPVKVEGKRDASVQRYKGLGEMNAEQLAETTMNPEKRTLLQVRLEDAVESEEVFFTLMAEDVESRRKVHRR